MINSGTWIIPDSDLCGLLISCCFSVDGLRLCGLFGILSPHHSSHQVILLETQKIVLLVGCFQRSLNPWRSCWALKLFISCHRVLGRVALWLVPVAAIASFYAYHVYYLAFVKFDYGYNMKVNITAGESFAFNKSVRILSRLFSSSFRSPEWHWVASLVLLCAWPSTICLEMLLVHICSQCLNSFGIGWLPSFGMGHGCSCIVALRHCPYSPSVVQVRHLLPILSLQSALITSCD